MNLPVRPDDRPRVQHELVVRLTVDGEPVPKGRPRFSRKGHTYTPAKTRQAETAVQWAAIQATRAHDRDWLLEAGPLALTAFFYCGGRLKDTDNMLKLVSDALNGVVWMDDRQVVQLHAARFDRQARPRTEIAVFRVVTR